MFLIEALIHSFLTSLPPYYLETLVTIFFAVLLSLPLLYKLQDYLNESTKLPRYPVKDTIVTLRERKKPALVMCYPNPIYLDSASSSSVNLNIRTVSSTPILTSKMEVTDKFPKSIPFQGHDLLLHQSSSFIVTNHEIPVIDISSSNYESYRHKLMENALLTRYKNQQPPGKVILNSIHFNSRHNNLGANFKNDLNFFNFITSKESPVDVIDVFKKREVEYLHPLDHFMLKGSKETSETFEKATETSVTHDKDNDKIGFRAVYPYVTNPPVTCLLLPPNQKNEKTTIKMSQSTGRNHENSPYKVTLIRNHRMSQSHRKDTLSQIKRNKSGETFDKVSQIQSYKSKDTFDKVSQDQSNKSKETFDKVSQNQSNKSKETYDKSSSSILMVKRSLTPESGCKPKKSMKMISIGEKKKKSSEQNLDVEKYSSQGHGIFNLGDLGKPKLPKNRNVDAKDNEIDEKPFDRECFDWDLGLDSKLKKYSVRSSNARRSKNFNDKEDKVQSPKIDKTKVDVSNDEPKSKKYAFMTFDEFSNPKKMEPKLIRSKKCPTVKKIIESKDILSESEEDRKKIQTISEDPQINFTEILELSNELKFPDYKIKNKRPKTSSRSTLLKKDDRTNGKSLEKTFGVDSFGPKKMTSRLPIASSSNVKSHFQDRLKNEKFSTELVVANMQEYRCNDDKKTKDNDKDKIENIVFKRNYTIMEKVKVTRTSEDRNNMRNGPDSEIPLGKLSGFIDQPKGKEEKLQKSYRSKVSVNSGLQK